MCCKFGDESSELEYCTFQAEFGQNKFAKPDEVGEYRMQNLISPNFKKKIPDFEVVCESYGCLKEGLRVMVAVEAETKSGGGNWWKLGAEAREEVGDGAG